LTSINNQFDGKLQLKGNQMAITARPKNTSPTTPGNQVAIEKFIGSAPDAAPAKEVASTTKVFSGTLRGKQVPITFTLPPELLTKVDEQAHKLSISRAAFIKQALTRAIVAEFT
jgi:hypothetical protein